MQEHDICEQKQFSSFLLNLDIVFPCLITMARVSNTVLKRKGKSRHPNLALDLRWKNLNILSLGISLTVYF